MIPREQASAQSPEEPGLSSYLACSTLAEGTLGLNPRRCKLRAEPSLPTEASYLDPRRDGDGGGFYTEHYISGCGNTQESQLTL